jgi:hypothetical protein
VRKILGDEDEEEGEGGGVRGSTRGVKERGGKTAALHPPSSLTEDELGDAGVRNLDHKLPPPPRLKLADAAHERRKRLRVQKLRRNVRRRREVKPPLAALEGCARADALVQTSKRVAF